MAYEGDYKNIAFRIAPNGLRQASYDGGKTWTAIIMNSYWSDTWAYGVGGQPKQEEKNVRGLFKVYFIDKDDDIEWAVVIANDEANARIKAWKKADLDDDIDNYHIICRRIGDVPTKKEIVKVKVVTD